MEADGDRLGLEGVAERNRPAMKTHKRYGASRRKTAEPDRDGRSRASRPPSARLGNQATGELLRSVERCQAVSSYDRVQYPSVHEFESDETTVEHVGKSARQDSAEREAEQLAAMIGPRAGRPPANIPTIRRSPRIHTEGQKGDDRNGLHRKSTIGTGQPLPDSVQQYFEIAFDADLSSTRIHTEPMAGKAAESIGASAFTDGSAVVFARGEYDLESAEGLELLSHELVHVIQQARGGPGSSIQRATRDDAKRVGGGREEAAADRPEPESIVRRNRQIRIRRLYVISERELSWYGNLRRIESMSEDFDYRMDSETIRDWFQLRMALQEFMNTAEEESGASFGAGSDETQMLQSEWVLDEWGDLLVTIGAYRMLAARSLKRDLVEDIETIQERLANQHQRYEDHLETIQEHREIARTGTRIKFGIDVLNALKVVGDLGRGMGRILADPRRLTPAIVRQTIESMRVEWDMMKASVDVLTSYYQQVELRGKSIDRVLDELEMTQDRMLEMAETLERRVRQHRTAEELANERADPPQ